MSAPAVAEALEQALRARVTIVIGESDTGKTTLITALANALTGQGLSVAVVDADPGQSEIGPPTTIGLGRIAGPLRRLGEAPAAALHFVGVTSPAGNLPGMLAGTRKMLERARGADRVLIDTSGLVAGDFGRVLKRRKIEITDPDLVICLERAGECAHIVDAYRAATRPTVLRLAAPAAGRRSPDERRRYREAKLRAYFTPARAVTLDLRRVRLRDARGESVVAGPAADQLQSVVAGLENGAAETLGLAVVRRLDVDTGVLSVDTPVPIDDVTEVMIGRETYPE